MRCGQCGFESASGAAFCSRCGARLAMPHPERKQEFAVLGILPSWWQVAPILVLAVLLVPVSILALLAGKQSWQIVPFGLVLSGALFGLAAFARRMLRWSLTSERLIERRGFLATRRREIELADIRSVEIERGLFQKLCGTGDVTVSSAASVDSAIRLQNVHGPEAIADTLRQARLKRLA